MENALHQFIVFIISLYALSEFVSLCERVCNHSEFGSLFFAEVELEQGLCDTFRVAASRRDESAFWGGEKRHPRSRWGRVRPCWKHGTFPFRGHSICVIDTCQRRFPCKTPRLRVLSGALRILGKGSGSDPVPWLGVRESLGGEL